MTKTANQLLLQTGRTAAPLESYGVLPRRGFPVGQRLGALLVLVALTGCSGAGAPSGTNDRRAFETADSWHAPPSDYTGFTIIDKDQFAVVADTLQSEAQAALAEVSAKRITGVDAARLIGHPLPAGEEYVLLRAVVLFEGTGAFDISMRERAVHVHHGCLGRHPAPMVRKALVAVLPVVPESVFVSCSMAE